MRICKADGCNKVLTTRDSRGLCNKHYLRFRKYGNPLTLIRTEPILHGLSKLPEYEVWCHMKQRCYDKNYYLYHRYGGRGITVCERWLHSFQNFIKDMGTKPFKDAQIDRINNNGNYEPNNCHWVTNIENIRNSTVAKLSMKIAKEIRSKYMNAKTSYKKLGVIYRVNETTIGRIIRNQTWT